MKIIILALYLASSVCGISLVKAGSANPLSITLTGGIKISAGYITILGLLFYLFSFLLYTKLLTLYDLSYIVPMAMAISQVLILIIAFFFFKEEINLYKGIGILLMLAGVVFINIKK